ncbi:MAG: hypothetical protein KDC98_03825 [Planctomycetes bacterium]|nr:hypothetical protein [Planctomycetota bacterium]
MISVLPQLLCLCLLCAFGPALTSQQDRQTEILVGSGEVDAEILENVRSLVDSGAAELAPVFPGLDPKPFAVFVHGEAELMPESLVALRHPGAPGFALLGQHQIHLVISDMRRSGASLSSVVKHELVHELLDQFTAPRRGRIPRWFHEGLAQDLAGDTYLGAREEDLVWRVGLRRLLAFADLERGFPRDEDKLRVAYAQSYSYVSWLVREFGLAAVVEIAAHTDQDTSLDQALVQQTGRSTIELYDAWTLYLQYGSGAWWRVLLGQCFNLLLVLAIPVLIVAWLRRRARGRLIARRMAQREAMFPHEFELERRDEEQPGVERCDVDGEKPGRDEDPGG